MSLRRRLALLVLRVMGPTDPPLDVPKLPLPPRVPRFESPLPPPPPRNTPTPTARYAAFERFGDTDVDELAPSPSCEP